MQPKQRLHFIAIGGSVMHNLAISLKQAGYAVSGSDDEFFEPSRSALEANGLLPSQTGWYADRIDQSIEAVIIGMHAKQDNPELLKAKELDIPVFSFPEFILKQAKDKQRIVIAGSHGKTTITGIIVHVLNYFKRDFDYIIGAKVRGIENNVKLSSKAPIIIIEGDEYFSSPLDPTPKFLRYQHHIGLISGVAWDHYNVFPTEEDYVRYFDHFADQTPKGGILIFCEQDPLAMMIGTKDRADVQAISYKSHPHTIDGNKFFLTEGKERYPINVFGSHNLLNINGAREVLKKLGISNEQFYEAIASFEGASGRLEKIYELNSFVVYKDFAHAPSKVKATVKAMKELNAAKDVVACLELHTYSSLNKNFLPQYRDSLKAAQTAIVYFNPEKIKAKNLEPLTEDEVRQAFNLPTLHVFTDAQSLTDFLLSQNFNNKNLLMMTSGDFGGIDIPNMAATLKA